MNSNDPDAQNNYCYGCMSRIPLHQAYNKLNDRIVDVTIPFTSELSDSTIPILKLNTNLKDRTFKPANISEALIASLPVWRDRVSRLATDPVVIIWASLVTF